jgi:hypothetical protein
MLNDIPVKVFVSDSIKRYFFVFVLIKRKKIRFFVFAFFALYSSVGQAMKLKKGTLEQN